MLMRPLRSPPVASASGQSLASAAIRLPRSTPYEHAHRNISTPNAATVSRVTPASPIHLARGLEHVVVVHPVHADLDERDGVSGEQHGERLQGLHAGRARHRQL